MPEETSMQRAMREAGIKNHPHKIKNKKERGGFADPHHKNILQNRFLKDLLTKKKPVTVRSTDGNILNGIITDFDDFSLMIESESGTEKELIFKHSVMSIKPT